MGDIVQRAKNYIKTAGGAVHVGSEEDSLVVPGSIFASGSIKIEAPYVKPVGSDPKTYDVLYTDGMSYEWKSEKIQVPITQDCTAGVDYIYVNSTRGFFIDDRVIINPYGATRETGVVGYSAQETKLYLAGKVEKNHYILDLDNR